VLSRTGWGAHLSGMLDAVGTAHRGDRYAMQRMLHVGADDILYAGGGHFPCPKFFLVRDQGRLVFVVRGTMSFSDALVDVWASDAEFAGGKASDGIARASRAVYDELMRPSASTARGRRSRFGGGRAVADLLSAGGGGGGGVQEGEHLSAGATGVGLPDLVSTIEYRDWPLVITGHSLGGGVATLVTLLLLRERTLHTLTLLRRLRGTPPSASELRDSAAASDDDHGTSADSAGGAGGAGGPLAQREALRAKQAAELLREAHSMEGDEAAARRDLEWLERSRSFRDALLQGLDRIPFAFTDVRCVAFAAPPTIAPRHSLDLLDRPDGVSAEEALRRAREDEENPVRGVASPLIADRITTYVNGDDLVSRWCLGSTRDLVRLLARIVESDPDFVRSTLGFVSADELATIEREARAGLAERAPRLYHPGRLVFLRKPLRRGTVFRREEIVAWSDVSMSSDVVVATDQPLPTISPSATSDDDLRGADHGSSAVVVPSAPSAPSLPSVPSAPSVSSTTSESTTTSGAAGAAATIMPPSRSPGERGTLQRRPSGDSLLTASLADEFASGSLAEELRDAKEETLAKARRNPAAKAAASTAAAAVGTGAAGSAGASSSPSSASVVAAADTSKATGTAHAARLAAASAVHDEEGEEEQAARAEAQTNAAAPHPPAEEESDSSSGVAAATMSIFSSVRSMFGALASHVLPQALAPHHDEDPAASSVPRGASGDGLIHISRGQSPPLAPEEDGPDAVAPALRPVPTLVRLGQRRDLHEIIVSSRTTHDHLPDVYLTTLFRIAQALQEAEEEPEAARARGVV
jgi:Lipase (class 3)